MAKIKEMVEGFVGQLAGKINFVAGKFYNKFRKIWDEKWYFQVSPLPRLDLPLMCV